MTRMGPIRCVGGTASLHPDGYVVIDQVPGSQQTWDSAVEMLEAASSLVPEGELAALVVLANQSRATREARRAFAEVGAAHVACAAMVVRSRISEVTGSFFLRLNQPVYPMRLFSSREAAAEWARPFVGTRAPEPSEAS